MRKYQIGYCNNNHALITSTEKNIVAELIEQACIDFQNQNINEIYPFILINEELSGNYSLRNNPNCKAEKPSQDRDKNKTQERQKSKLKINGWWRIWIVLSCIWSICVLSFATLTWFNEGKDEEIASHLLIYQSLNQSEKDKILDLSNFGSNNQSNRIGPSVKMPNGYVVNFKSGITMKEMEEWSENYFSKGSIIQYQERKEFIYYLLAFLLVPLLLLALLGISIAWVTKGFRN